MTLSHLWAEELLSGDPSVDVKADVYGNLDRAAAVCAEMNAEPDSQGEWVQPVVDPEIRGQVAPSCQDIEGMRQLTEARLGLGGRHGEQAKAEVQRVHRDGHLVPVSLTISPIYSGSVIVGIASIQQDMSERRQKDAALAAAREEALESSRAKWSFSRP